MRAGAQRVPSWGSSAVAPRLTQPDKALQRSNSKIGVADAAVLLCEVRASKGKLWDPSGRVPIIPFVAEIPVGGPAPDLRLTLTIGSLPPIAVDAPGDNYAYTVAVPNPCLAQGEGVTVHAIDRDPGEDEDVGTAVLRLDASLPINAKLEQGQVTCRGLSAQDAKQLASESLVVFDKLPAANGVALEPKPGEANWGYPSDTLGKMKATLEGAASFVGWAEPELARRISVVNDVQRSWREIVQKSMRTTRDNLPAPGTWIRSAALEVRVGKPACKEETSLLVFTDVLCSVPLELKNKTARALDPWETLSVLGWIDSDGTDRPPADARFEDEDAAGEGKWWKPGAVVRITLDLSVGESMPNPSEPLLVKIHRKQGPGTLLRVY
jgi:hypothetical protein